ncbi:MAG: hypothetical protein JW818_04765 [Pirellulales bacterium]|nr:hypothetical protein [Pirellulales bacterium]
MQVLAGSLNVAVDDFLHAGYISAHPRFFGQAGPPDTTGRKTEVINVAKALELKQGDSITETQSMVQHAPARPSQPASMVSGSFVLLSSFLFFAYLVSLYYRRVGQVKHTGWWIWTVASVLIVAWGIAFYHVYPRGLAYALHNQAPPWEGAAIQEYRDPAAATWAIQQTLIASSLPGCPVEVNDLTAIQGEVAFPESSGEQTPGMEYAVKTYGLDGWGRAFRVNRFDSGRYSIVSAGADGHYDSDDDLVAFVEPGEGSDWENRVNGFFVSLEDDKDVCFVHRVSDHFYRPRNPTRDKRFDRVPLERLVYHPKDEDPPSVLLELAECRASHSAADNPNPLLFVRMVKPPPVD